MLRTGLGLSEWGRSTEDLSLAGRIGDMLGCGIGRGGERRARGQVDEAPPGYDDWPEIIAGEAPALRQRYGRLEFAVVQTGPWDVADRRLDGYGTWRAPGDPVLDEYLYDESRPPDLLLEQDLVVVWVLAPHIEVGRTRSPRPTRRTRSPTRLAWTASTRSSCRWRARGGRGRRPRGLPAAPARRRDGPGAAPRRGVHVTPESAVGVAAWLGPELVAAVAAEGSDPMPPEAEPVAPAPGPAAAVTAP